MLILQDNTIFETVKDPNMQAKRTRADHIPVPERLNSLNEIAATYTKEQAENEAARCLKCPTHWCQKMCPAGVPVTDFIAAFRGGDIEGAYKLIRSASTLPEICSRVCPQDKQCRSNCTRSINNQAVGTGNLERYVVEQHYASGKGEENAPSTGKKIAVIGSGPAGLSAAQALVSKGHSVTVYEKDDRAGGLLEYGIPNMKLEKSIVERKVKSLESQGVKFVLNTAVGAGADTGSGSGSGAVDITPDDLIKDFDAVILAIGTRNARMINADNIALAKGVYTAVQYLSSTTKSLLDSDMTDGKNISGKDKDVIIVGGGDTGNDCVGTAIRNGAKSVTQIEMMPKHMGNDIVTAPHYPKIPERKVNTSQEEARMVYAKDPHIYQATVKSVNTDASGNIESVTIVSLEAKTDDDGRLQMKEIPGTEKTLPCGLLLIAAGFSGPEKKVTEAFNVATDTRTNITADNFATNIDKVFTCGDCHTGQSLVVKAMVEGRNCAEAVDAYVS